MESIVFSLVCIGFILLLCLVGWFLEKFLSRYVENDNICVLIKNSVIENYHCILLFFFFVTIAQAGFQNILWPFFKDKGDAMAKSSMLSFFLVGFTFSWLNKKRKLIKQFRSLIKLAAANDNNFLHRLSLNNPDHFLETRDIPLSLILEKEGMTKGFRENIELAKKELEDIGPQSAINGRIVYGRVYKNLKLLDTITLALLSDNIIKKYPRESYFLRLNLIDMALPYVYNDTFLILGKPADGEEIINEFWKLALNRFYKHPKYMKYRSEREYTEQPASFNINALEEYLQKNK